MVETEKAINSHDYSNSANNLITSGEQSRKADH